MSRCWSLVHGAVHFVTGILPGSHGSFRGHWRLSPESAAHDAVFCSHSLSPNEGLGVSPGEPG